MSKYTLTIKQIVENDGNIFNFDYPIFSESYRKTLETNIINHYYFREIGVETVGRFIFNLKAKLNLIMPYYNQLYKSAMLDFNPLINYQVKEVYKRKNVGKNNSNSNSNSTNNITDASELSNENIIKRVFCDTPQSSISINNFMTDITETSNNNTSKGKNNSNSNSNSNGAVSQASENSEDYERTMEGNIGVQTFSQLLTDYRKTFINIDEMIINELHDMFMLVY